MTAIDISKGGCKIVKQQLHPAKIPMNVLDYSLVLQYARETAVAWSKQEAEIFEISLQQFAVPPIKGKITRGKVKYRGIRRVTNGNDVWLEQRGRRISPILTYSSEL